MIRKREKTYYGGPVFPVAWCTFLVCCCLPSGSPLPPPFRFGPAIPSLSSPFPASRLSLSSLVPIVPPPSSFPSWSWSSYFLRCRHPCRVVPVLLLVFVLVFLARCFLRVFVISCCPCCPAVLLSFRVVLVAVSGLSGSLLVLIVLAMIVPRSVLVFLCCGVAILDNT
jgi:hypothetical protein